MNIGIKTSISLLLCIYFVLGNIRIISLRGGHIAPGKETTVRIEKEYVKIKLFRDFIRVTCRFWIKSTKRDEKLSIAFPYSLSNLDMSPSTRVNDKTDFKVFVDGKQIDYEQNKDTTKSFSLFNNKYWFTFSVQVKKDSTHLIECTYQEDHWYYNEYSYLIGSAVTWADNIGIGTIVFDHSNLCSKRFVYSPSTYAEQQDQSYPFPIKLKPIQHEDSLVYKFKDYKPDSLEIVQIRIFKYWVNHSIYLRQSADLKHYESKPLYRMDPLIEWKSRWKYGWKNQFIFEFLGDTSKFCHNYNYKLLKEEIFEKKKIKRPLSTLFAKERTVIEILSRDLDSLRNTIIKRKSMSGKAKLLNVELLIKTDSVNLKKDIDEAKEKTEIEILSRELDSLQNAIFKRQSMSGKVKLLNVELLTKADIDERVKWLNGMMDLLAPVYMDSIEGDLSVLLSTDTDGFVDSVKYDTNMKSKDGVITILGILGIKRRLTFYFPLKESKVKLELNIEID